MTSIFLHASIMHMFFNMLALFFFGPTLERRIGSTNFLMLYFGSGILAGLAQIFMFPLYPVIGASGAIFGVLGALTILMPDMTVYLYFVPLKMKYVTILFAILDLYPILNGQRRRYRAYSPFNRARHRACCRILVPGKKYSAQRPLANMNVLKRTVNRSLTH